MVMICQLFSVDAFAENTTTSPIDTPITKAELEILLDQTVKGGHPYLMGRKSDFQRVRQYALGGDSLITEQYAHIKRKAETYLSTAVKEISNPSVSYLSIGFNSAWSIVPYCAFVYLIEGDEAYAERAYAEAEYYADMPSWGDYQYIDNTQSAMAVALCYDWLYDWLDDTQKTKLEEALKQKHLDNVKEAYYSGTTTGIARHLRGNHNHAVMNSATIFMQALSIADGGDISYSAEIMAASLAIINEPLSAMYPDSGWREGMGYWGFVGPMIARMMLSMKSSFGSCLGYENIDYVINTAYFPIYSASSQGAFVFNDANYLVPDTSFDKYILAYLGGDKALMRYSLSNDELSHPFFCLAYDRDASYDTQTEWSPAKDKHFSESGIATMRSSWDSRHGLFAAMAVQRANVSHGHQNSGTVGFDALGERWITNTGGDNYSLDGYFTQPERWSYYATRAEANSCVVINPSSDGGQNIDSDDTINTFNSGEDGAYAVADLTDTYAGQVSSYKRGISLTNNRRRFVLQDEIVMSSPSQMYSFINIYKADITIGEDKKSAIISKGDKKLYMNIICDNPFELSVMDSVPLTTSPNPDGQSRFEDIQKIVIKVDDASAVNLRVSFTPYLIDKELEYMKKDSFVAIADWTTDVSAAAPEAESIYIDGTRYDSFSKENRIFELETDSAISSVEVGVKSDFEAEVACDSASGKTEIFVYDKTDRGNNYSYVLKAVSSDAAYANSVRHISGDDNTAVTTNSGDTSISANKLVLYRFELPSLQSGEKYDSAVLNFTAGVFDGAVTGSNIRFVVYGLNNDFQDPADLTYSSLSSYITVDNLMSSPKLIEENAGCKDSAVYHFFSLDVTDLANACLDSQREYMYVAISGKNCNIKLWGTSVKAGYENWRSGISYVISKKTDISSASAFKYYAADETGKTLVTMPLIAENGFTVRAINDSTEEFKFDFIVAAYDDKEMTACNINNIVVAPNIKTEVFDDTISSGAAKAFVWSADMTPITHSTTN